MRLLMLATSVLGLCGAPAQAASVAFDQLPSLEETAKVYPQAAVAGNFGGQVTLRCQVRDDGGVRDCAVTSELPQGLGFGSAALTLASQIRIRPAADKRAFVDAPIEFLPLRPTDAVFKRDRANRGLGGVGPYYPIVAVDAGATGVAMIACTRGTKGELNSCRVLAEAPQKVFFGAAALRMAETRWITVAPRENGAAQVGEPVAVLVPFTMDKRRR